MLAAAYAGSGRFGVVRAARGGAGFRRLALRTPGPLFDPLDLDDLPTRWTHVSLSTARGAGLRSLFPTPATPFGWEWGAEVPSRVRPVRHSSHVTVAITGGPAQPNP